MIKYLNCKNIVCDEFEDTLRGFIAEFALNAKLYSAGIFTTDKPVIMRSSDANIYKSWADYMKVHPISSEAWGMINVIGDDLDDWFDSVNDLPDEVALVDDNVKWLLNLPNAERLYKGIKLALRLISDEIEVYSSMRYDSELKILEYRYLDKKTGKEHQDAIYYVDKSDIDVDWESKDDKVEDINLYLDSYFEIETVEDEALGSFDRIFKCIGIGIGEE